MLREWISLKISTEPAFVKASQPPDGGAKDGGELSHPFHGMVDLSSVESSGGFKNPPIIHEEINDYVNESTQGLLEEIESWPPNKFGRGQAVSSFQFSPVSTGFRPKPITQWRLLGGAGGKPRKKMEPSTKAQQSSKGNYTCSVICPLLTFIKIVSY